MELKSKPHNEITKPTCLSSPKQLVFCDYKYFQHYYFLKKSTYYRLFSLISLKTIVKLNFFRSFLGNLRFL